MPEVVHSIADVRSAVAAARGAGLPIGLTPTMGALHEGHLSHIVAAKARGAFSVVSVFVNPLQFGVGEDFDRYPRTLPDDVAALATVGADLVFAPDLAEMYPDGGVEVSVSAGPVGRTFEGKARPGHFDGALTVVLKLLEMVQPDFATFGQKDAQQLWLVTRMTRDLDVPVEILPVPILREADGLAMSSRNRYLSPEQRAASSVLSRGLAAAGAVGPRQGAAAAIAAAYDEFATVPLVDVEYFTLVDPATFRPVTPEFEGEARAILAAHVGSTRLLDNGPVRLGTV